MIARTRQCLGSLHADVQNQIAIANTELDEAADRDEYRRLKAGQADWRRRTIGFRRMIEKRIGLVRSRIPAPAPQSPFGAGFTKTARKHNRAALEHLARAVAEHRRRVLSGDGSEDDDETLWQCLTTVTAISRDGEALPLAEWLQYLDELQEDGQ